MSLSLQINCNCLPTQMEKHIMVPTLVWAVGQFSLMMLTVPQVGLTICYNATAGQFYIITVTILLMLVWVVKVSCKICAGQFMLCRHTSKKR